MNDLSADQFWEFFRELHGHDPYSWQIRLAARALEGNWPGAIDLPTGSGKTACIDVAIFALACQASRGVADRKAPRRIFFCVNRRVIVDEAHQRARRIAQQLAEVERNKVSDSPILVRVAAALRVLAGTSIQDEVPPLDVLELRGGIYRDNRWARSAAQPTVVCTTIDQLGSRLLFRGYGVSPNAAPIQAALVAYDSLVLLDEAHISQPFLQSLSNVSRFLDPTRWAKESIGVRPMIVVPMTATPPNDVAPSDVIRLDAADRANESLDRRLKATKRAILHPVGDVSKAIVDHVETHAEAGCAAIGIIVNRVATAREIYELIRKRHPDARVELVIGAMRPSDRDTQAERLAMLVGGKRPAATTTASFVIATQCLEVGADYDFDVLLTQCASLDALRQRFGRLNRGGRQIAASAVIVVNNKDVKPDDALDKEKPLDPVYGNATAHTWNWLWEHADAVNTPTAPEINETTGKRAKIKATSAAGARTIDFGIDAFKSLLDKHFDGGQISDKLLAPSASLPAPVMLPAYIDFWCQTSPIPAPDPDVALFIHGKRNKPDVQVCWRADLIKDEFVKYDQWPDIIALLPPTTAECMRVPFSRVLGWLSATDDREHDMGDLLAVASQVDDESNGVERGHKGFLLKRRGVLWRGDGKSEPLRSPDQLRPGDTLVLPVEDKGWDDLGHIPGNSPQDHVAADEAERDESSGATIRPDVDVAEAAFLSVRGKHVLRLHEWRRAFLPKTAGLTFLLDRVADFADPPDLKELRNLMREAAVELPTGDGSPREALEYFDKNGFIREPYPDRRGIVITARRRIEDRSSRFLPPLDEGDDEVSRTGRDVPVTLHHHTIHVGSAVAHILDGICTCISSEIYSIAAKRHDWGKADERFQALLRGTDRTDAWLFAGQSPCLLAKSDGVPRTPSARKAASERSGLPAGFRHEMLSVQLAELVELPAAVVAERDLILHLIAAHHGYARPFAPVALDDEPLDVNYEGVALSSADRLGCPPHRLDSAIADRFWSLVRRYGWWGLAYLESLLRLADQQASAGEDAGKYDDDHSVPESTEARA